MEGGCYRGDPPEQYVMRQQFSRENRPLGRHNVVRVDPSESAPRTGAAGGQRLALLSPEKNQGVAPVTNARSFSNP